MLSNFVIARFVCTYMILYTPHSVPSSCTLCQPVLIVSTSDKKYRSGVPFGVPTKQVGLYTGCALTMDAPWVGTTYFE